MGRVSLITRLPPEQQSRVDALLRRYQYGSIDLVNEELAEAGVAISRSALHRHAQRLRDADSLRANAPDSTVVVIMDLRTGTATQVRTSATPAAVISAIGTLGPPVFDVSDVPESTPSGP